LKLTAKAAFERIWQEKLMNRNVEEGHYSFCQKFSILRTSTFAAKPAKT